MTVMVSVKFVYLLPEQWREASGVAGNGLITQNNKWTAQPVPDNAGLVTPNSNKIASLKKKLMVRLQRWNFW